MLTKALIALAILVSVGVAACGDDDEDTTAASETTAPEETTTAEETTTSETGGGGGAGGGGETVQVTETDFAIDPADPTVKAGTVTFEVTNDGAAPHNLEIEGNGVEEELDADLASGESGTLTVDLEPGTYEWYCPVGNHADMGMEGELTVE